MHSSIAVQFNFTLNFVWQLPHFVGAHQNLFTVASKWGESIDPVASVECIRLYLYVEHTHTHNSPNTIKHNGQMATNIKSIWTV